VNGDDGTLLRLILIYWSRQKSMELQPAQTKPRRCVCFGSAKQISWQAPTPALPPKADSRSFWRNWAGRIPAPIATALENWRREHGGRPWRFHTLL